MRLRFFFAVLGVAAGCGSQDAPASRVERVASTRSRIAYGSADSTHTAVVALLAPVGMNTIGECTGSIVQVSGIEGYVLTAAHCCNANPPNVVVLSNDFTVGEQYVFGGTPKPPVYAVEPGSVWWDALYAGSNPPSHDFCMLKFSSAPAGTAVLALPPASGDGLSLGSSIEHVGYGVTESGSNTGRRTGTDAINTALTSLLVEYSQGGTTQIPGTCEGDSGGPALFPAGVAQSSQVVVAVTSFANSASCAQTTEGGASRVTSALGTGAFITQYLLGAPIGNRVGPPAAAPAGGFASMAATALGLLALGAFRLRLRSVRRAATRPLST
jgi:hypothetical protein